MSKTITFDIFDPSSIQHAAQEIREYSKWVQGKTTELQERVATLIANQARMGFNNSISDDLIGEPAEIGNVAVYVENNGNVTLVVASGEDAVFMEFGAGVLYNGAVGSSPNPLGADLGFTIGSYGKGNGAKTTWGFIGSDGQVHLTHGTPASMPLYKSLMAVKNDIVRIAREVFSA